MYCLSVFDESTKFHSVLELQQLTKLNKNFLHVIWGFSKVIFISLILQTNISIAYTQFFMIIGSLFNKF